MDTKKTYHDKKEELIRELGARIDELRKKADQSKSEVKIIYYEQLESLRKNLEIAKKKLHELKDAGEGKWEGLKEGAEDAIDELKKSVEELKGKFKK